MQTVICMILTSRRRTSNTFNSIAEWANETEREREKMPFSRFSPCFSAPRAQIAIRLNLTHVLLLFWLFIKRKSMRERDSQNAFCSFRSHKSKEHAKEHIRDEREGERWSYPAADLFTQCFIFG